MIKVFGNIKTYRIPSFRIHIYIIIIQLVKLVILTNGSHVRDYETYMHPFIFFVDCNVTHNRITTKFQYKYTKRNVILTNCAEFRL